MRDSSSNESSSDEEEEEVDSDKGHEKRQLDYLFFTQDWEIIFAQWEEMALSQTENVNDVKYMS